MSEIYEFQMDADGNGTDDYVVAEQFEDGSIYTVATWTGTGSRTSPRSTTTATAWPRRPTRSRAATPRSRPRRSP